MFGLQNRFHKIDEQIYYENLSQAVCKNGFSDYSAYGITSFFSFRYPVLHWTMFDDFRRKSHLDSFNSLRFDTRKDISISQSATIAEYLLIESIKKKVQNARRIGILLSGGLDSSLLVAICKRLYPEREIYTYSMGFYGDDEFEYSREVANRFSTIHYEKVLDYTDFFDKDSLMKALIKHKAAPLHPNELPLAYAETQARKDCCDIVLCGEGADELFGGYSHNLLMYVSFQGDKKDFYRYILSNYRYISSQKLKSIIHDQYIVDDMELIAPLSLVNMPDDIRNIMLHFIQSLHTRGLVDRGANALSFCGFENGFVFLDSALIDFVNSLPFDYKVCANIPVPQYIKDYKYFSDKYCIAKFLLKYIAKSYLPESIINRVKKGFPVPFALWDKKKPFTMDLHTQIFKSNDLSCFTAWEKFMIYNLNTFVEVFDKYRGGVALNCATYYKSLLVLTFYSFTFFRLLILFALFVSYVACLYLRAYLL